MKFIYQRFKFNITFTCLGFNNIDSLISLIFPLIGDRTIPKYFGLSIEPKLLPFSILVPRFLSLIDCSLPEINDKIGIIPIFMQFSLETSTHTKLSVS